MALSDTDRRLAAIVAVDIAGFSSRAEADEADAIAAVQALALRIAQTARDHGGRVFNTAGDGFMLEFHTASGALAAAKDLAAEAETPIRIGVHLGEVYATATGDLLGHGVNVAARLQALAKPGAIMVSDDVRRTVRGALAQGLVSQGRHRLDKMKETAEVFSLSAASVRGRVRLPAWATGKVGLAIAGMALAVAILGVGAGAGWSYFKPESKARPNLITAVRDFAVQSAGLDPQYGRTVADSVAAALGERQSPTVSRDLVRQGKFGGARLLVGGEVVQVGQTLREHIHIDDGQAGLILWSADLERPADQADGLRDATAAKLADIIDRTRTETGPEIPGLKPEALAAVIRAEEADRLGPDGRNLAREAWQRVVALAPKFSRGHSSLAFYDAFYHRGDSNETIQRDIAQAQDELKIALALDSHNGDAFVVKSSLVPSEDLAGQETWLLKGLAVDPDNPTLNAKEADLLASVGRSAESLVLHKKALDGDPLSTGKTLGLAFALIGVGRTSDAQVPLARVRRLWPDYQSSSLSTATQTEDLVYGDLAAGRAFLNAQAGAGGFSPRVIGAWRKVLDAKAGKFSPEVAARGLADAAQADDQVDLEAEESALAQLGQVDLAFKELDRRIFVKHARFFQSTLFAPANASLWKDQRFARLADRLGLPAYWRTTGHWPDICALAGGSSVCPTSAKAGGSA